MPVSRMAPLVRLSGASCRPASRWAAISAIAPEAKKRSALPSRARAPTIAMPAESSTSSKSNGRTTKQQPSP